LPIPWYAWRRAEVRTLGLVAELPPTLKGDGIEDRDGFRIDAGFPAGGGHVELGVAATTPGRVGSGSSRRRPAAHNAAEDLAARRIYRQGIEPSTVRQT